MGISPYWYIKSIDVFMSVVTGKYKFLSPEKEDDFNLD